MFGSGPSEAIRIGGELVVKVGWLVAGGGALVALSSCGAIVEAAVENAVEEAAGVEVEEGEDGSFSIEGGDISIQLDADEDGGTLSIDGPDGSIEVDASEDGTVNVASEDFDGQEDSELSITSDAEVPDGFPLPYPDGGVVESGTTWDTGELRLMTVSMRYGLSRLDELISFYDDYFEGMDTLTNWDTESSGQRNIGYSINPDGQATAALISTSDEGIAVFLETTVVVE